jgi:hypothetical protein
MQGFSSRYEPWHSPKWLGTTHHHRQPEIVGKGTEIGITGSIKLQGRLASSSTAEYKWRWAAANLSSSSTVYYLRLSILEL